MNANTAFNSIIGPSFFFFFMLGLLFTVFIFIFIMYYEDTTNREKTGSPHCFLIYQADNYQLLIFTPKPVSWVYDDHEVLSFQSHLMPMISSKLTGKREANLARPSRLLYMNIFNLQFTGKSNFIGKKFF